MVEFMSQERSQKAFKKWFTAVENRKSVKADEVISSLPKRSISPPYIKIAVVIDESLKSEAVWGSGIVNIDLIMEC